MFNVTILKMPPYGRHLKENLVEGISINVMLYFLMILDLSFNPSTFISGLPYT